jgi:hypothetical protein
MSARLRKVVKLVFVFYEKKETAGVLACDTDKYLLLN